MKPLFKNWGLKKQFTVVFLVLIILPSLLMGIWIYFQATGAFKQQAINNTNDRLELNERTIQSAVQRIENMSSYMIYDDHFRTFFTAAEEERKAPDYKLAVKGINGYFTFQIMSLDYIDSISLTARDGHQLEFGENRRGEETRLIEQAKKLAGGIYWSAPYSVRTSKSKEKQIISVMRVINDLNEINKPIGYMTIRLNAAALLKSIETRMSKVPGTYFVLDDKGMVILHESRELIGTLYPNRIMAVFAGKPDEMSVQFKENGKNFLAVKKRIEGTDWYTAAIVSQSETVKGLYHTRNWFLLSFVLLILLGVIAWIGFYHANIKRILVLTEQTSQLKRGDFEAKVKVESKDEIGMLGMRFNAMAASIQNLINREFKLEIKQKESELKMLQSQIDPHFLYNTLDMIRWTARLENAMETGQLIERLSQIFRMSLNRGKMQITVKEEMIFLYNYLELQRSRMGNRLRYSIFYDAGIEKHYIIKQLIQPLVENSIEHGFAGKNSQGVIRVRAYRHENELWIDVIDNGSGIREKGLETGYAIKNIRDRIHILYGKTYGLEHIQSAEGAWLQLRLPLLPEAEGRGAGDEEDL